MFDPLIVSQYRERTARSWGADIVLTAWQGQHPARRAATIYAQGDPIRAGTCDPNWKLLADGDLAGALKACRNQTDPYAMQLEAETLITAGSVVAGLERLRRLHNKGLVSASLSLTRRLYMLGDFSGAVAVAMNLPWHAHIVMLGARAAIMNKNYDLAQRFIEPLLLGLVPVPDTENAGGVIVVTATLLMHTGEYERLQSFITSILTAVDLPDIILPSVARAAWMAGFGQQAWDKLIQHQSDYTAAAMAELAVLVGNVEVAQKWIKAASHVGAPIKPALRMLTGEVLTDFAAKEEAAKIFAKGNEVHIWRTHPYRWEPWIHAAKATEATIQVYDLKAGTIPAADASPAITIDDSALLDILPPLPTPTKPRKGETVWVADKLCKGFSVPLDWPQAETDRIYGLMQRAPSMSAATLVIASAEQGMELAATGRPVIVIAPPGDPFWNGVLPEKAWPGMGVIKAHPERGWNGAGLSVAKISAELFKIMTPYFEDQGGKAGKTAASGSKSSSKSSKSTGKRTAKSTAKSTNKRKGKDKT